jgi:hypothetical protein
MTAELCPTCGLWWRGMEHSCRLPIYSTSTAGLSLADTDPRDAEIARLRAALYRVRGRVVEMDDACAGSYATGHSRNCLMLPALAIIDEEIALATAKETP